MVVDYLLTVGLHQGMQGTLADRSQVHSSMRVCTLVKTSNRVQHGVVINVVPKLACSDILGILWL